MPLLIALVAAAVIVAIVARHRRPTRNCSWREDRADSKGALIKYNCATCGAEAYRSTGQPDKCLSNLNKPGL